MSSTMERQAADAGPQTDSPPVTLPAAETADDVLIPDEWKGRFVKFHSKGGESVIRFSTATTTAGIVDVDGTDTASVAASGAITPGGAEPHVRLADGETEHVRIDSAWTYFSYKTDASTTLDACLWTGVGK